MKLYYAPDTCSLSPHIVLRELNLEFELVRVNNRSKVTADGRDFLTINPKGYVAALELDDGQILTEGPAMVQYLADRKPEYGHTRAVGKGCACRNGLTLSPVKYTRVRRRCLTPRWRKMSKRFFETSYSDASIFCRRRSAKKPI